MALKSLSFRLLKNHFKKLDWIMVFCAAALAAVGILGIYSASLRTDVFNFEKQIAFFLIGVALMFIISLFDYRILRNNSYLILIFYFISLILLIGVFFFTPLIRGKRGWYKIGFLSFDPIEVAKLVIIILLAKYFSMRHVEMYKFWHIVFSGIYVLLPCILIFLQPDMGSVLIILIMWLVILVVSGIKIKHFLVLSLMAILLTAFAWGFLLKDYQRGRILAFISPYDNLGSSWSQTQAKIAIGSGQIWGKGFTKGTQTQDGFLPEPHTDFIFSVIAEEFGFLGVAVVFGLFFTLIWRILKIAIASQSNFPRLFSVGFAIVLIAHFFINVGMNLGVLPVIGIYLPFISYGGSGLIANFVGLGIMQSIRART